jgi:hypothetical protein
MVAGSSDMANLFWTGAADHNHGRWRCSTYAT